MKQLEESIEIDTNYLEMFIMCSIGSSADVDSILELFPCDIPTFNVSDVL